MAEIDDHEIHRALTIVICFISGEICQDSSTQFRNLLFLLHRFEVIKSNETYYEAHNDSGK